MDNMVNVPADVCQRGFRFVARDTASLPPGPQDRKIRQMLTPTGAHYLFHLGAEKARDASSNH